MTQHSLICRGGPMDGAVPHLKPCVGVTYWFALLKRLYGPATDPICYWDWAPKGRTSPHEAAYRIEWGQFVYQPRRAAA